jgi:hypothetical protein
LPHTRTTATKKEDLKRVPQWRGETHTRWASAALTMVVSLAPALMVVVFYNIFDGFIGWGVIG